MRYSSTFPQQYIVVCKNIVWLKTLYIPFFSSVFLLIPMQPQNKICTAYSQGTIRQPQEFSKKLKQQFLRGQRSKLEKAWFLLPSSNEAMQDTKWKPILYVTKWYVHYNKTSKIGKVAGNWIVAGTAKTGKWFNAWMVLTRKPYSIWGSNCGWVHMTTSTSNKPNFLRFWDGHVKTLVELIWNYPLMLCNVTVIQ